MTDRPIIFSAPMVRALLDGRKTQTRRITKRQDSIHVDGKGGWLYPGFLPYATRDRLYVREHWRTTAAYDDLSPSEMSGEEPIHYAADGSWEGFGWMDAGYNEGRFRQGMHMPRWASRLTLTVTDVRVQRLQDISEADARAEGLVSSVIGWKATEKAEPESCARYAFRTLWNTLHGPDAWDANPWVVALTFTARIINIDQSEDSYDRYNNPQSLRKRSAHD